MAPCLCAGVCLARLKGQECPHGRGATLTGSHAVLLSEEHQAQLTSLHGKRYPASMPYYTCKLGFAPGLYVIAYVFDAQHALVPVEHAHKPIVSVEVL